jgi:hypothetical protein
VGYDGNVNSTLKTILKVAAVVAVPGMGIYLLARTILRDLDEKREFREYINKTYGEGSNYVDRYQ